MNPIALSIIQASVVLGLAPLTVGLDLWIKARLQGRQGARPWLPYFRYATLLKKENLISSTGSWLLPSAPYVVLGTTVFLALALPLLVIGSAFAGMSNFMVLAMVIALGSIFRILGGLDAGSALTGPGTSRELTMLALLAPTVVLTFTAFALASGTTNIDGMMSDTTIRGTLLLSAPYLGLSLMALILMALLVNDRYPVGDQATVFASAMLGKATTLDYSGPYLAMLEYAAAVKLTIFSLFIANIIWPHPLLQVSSSIFDVLAVIAVTCIKVAIMMFILSVFESTTVRLRFYRVQEILAGAFFLALTGLALALLYQLV